MAESLKSHSLAKLDGISDPRKHVASINMHMAIIKALKSLKCKLLSSTFRDTKLRWYMTRYDSQSLATKT